MTNKDLTKSSKVSIVMFTIGASVVLLLACIGCTNRETDVSSNSTAGASSTSPPSAPSSFAKSVAFDTTNRVEEEGWWASPLPPAAPPTDPTPVDTTLQISGDVLFDVDKADLAPSAASQLEGLLGLAHAHTGGFVTITGFTDSDGSEEHNLELSLRRAQSVAAWLAENGIDMNRVNVQGRGEADPVAPNDSDEHRAANRRVVITIQST